MVLSRFDIDISIADMARLAVDNGARAESGTDIWRLSKLICAKYALELSTTNDEQQLKIALTGEVPAVAIANVGGDRAGYTGLFSEGGHYIVVAGIDDKNAVCFDPNLYPRKFERAGRRGSVTLNGNMARCALEALHMDTLSRTPNYFVFTQR